MSTSWLDAHNEAQEPDEPAPRRVQRTRTRGGGMPEGAVYVGRPTRWGNPYRVGDPDPMAPGHTLTAETAVRMYAWYLESRDELRADARRELAGRDLACWCKPGAPCHADELMRRANETVR